MRSRASCSWLRSWRYRQTDWCVRPAGSAARPRSMFRPTPTPCRSGLPSLGTRPVGSATLRSAQSPARSRPGPRLRKRFSACPGMCRSPRSFVGDVMPLGSRVSHGQSSIPARWALSGETRSPSTQVKQTNGESPMLSRRQMFLRATALAGAAAVASLPFALAAYGLEGDAKVGADVVAWLKANALPLATTEPGKSFHDLEPLRAKLAKARIVGLGETTHGTREFFQLKHRVIEYCVSQLGFNIIAFEANYGTMLAVNDYVLGGKGNFDDAVMGLGFPIWDTEEVHALIKWARNWNLSHERKVKFHGVDMQGSAGAALHVLAYLERVAPALAAASERTLAPLISYFTFDRFSELPTSVQDAVCAQIQTVIDAFAAERAGWVGRSSDMDWRLARQSALLLDRFTRSKRIRSEDLSDAFAVRDRFMADTALALLEAEGPGSKALLWAHNGHVKKEDGYEFAMGTVDWPIMGHFLQSAL